MSCSQSIAEGGGKDLCTFRGYTDYDSAHSAWTGFQRTGIMPSGVTFVRQSSRGATSPTPVTPQRSSRGSTSHSHTPVTPQRSSRGTTSRQGTPALHSPASLSPSPVFEDAQFWVVLSGNEPGVYQAL